MVRRPLADGGRADEVVERTPGGARLRLWVAAGARATRIAGIDPWRKALVVHVAAIPERGAANAAVRLLLADRLQVSPVSVELVSGATDRTKVVRIAGISHVALRDRIRGLLGSC